MKLFIINDDINSFEHVVECIQRYLNYPYLQSHSIANIVHNNGECVIKESDDDELMTEISESLEKSGINIKIEK
tara:strand:+ start:890 stop:1111 length:222 start_codon:yes stop_codon:yes gene_type:complete